LFALVLAEKLGFPSARHLLESITSAELEEWRAFYRMRREEEAQQMAAARAESALQRRRR
jgi:hypothetical protein